MEIAGLLMAQPGDMSIGDPEYDKFFKQDFLEKTGLKEREPEEPTDHQLMLAVVDALTAILESQKSILMQLDQQNEMIHAIAPGFALRCMENKTAASGN